MKNKFYHILIFVFASAATFISSCVKEDTDEPLTANVDPAGLSANTFIGALNVLASDTIKLITSDVVIAGIVVADDESGNFYKQMILQDTTGGISVQLDASNFNTEYPIGRRVFIKCKGLYFQKDQDGNIGLGVNENNSVGRIPQSLVSQYLVKGMWGLTVKPLKISIANLFGDAVHTNMLVEIDSAEFSKDDTSKTYANAFTKQSANLIVKQCNSSATLSVYSSGFADFASTKAAKGNGSITGIFTLYNNAPELQIRNIGDVKMTGFRCGTGVITTPLTYLNETFSGQSNNADVQISGWQNIAVQGNRYWQGKTFMTEIYAQATAFGSGLPAMETWLITPPLDLSVADTLAFQSAMAFWFHDGMSIWISTNFNGTNFGTATWTQLFCTLAGQSNANYDWVQSGDVLLTAFSGTGYVAFKYVGDGTTNTTTYQLDNVVVH